jgi:superfamily II DNA or RNA helicase
MIYINEAKDKLQREVGEILLNNNGGITLLPTGSGKAKIAIDYINKVKPEKILLIVPTTKLRDSNWKTEFEEWGTIDVYNRIDRYCYASINKLKGKHYDLIIMDELQNITPLNSQFFDSNNYNTLIGLTATMPKEQEKVDIIHNLKLKVVYELSLDDAVKLGIVAPFKINVYKVSIDDSKKYVLSGNKKNPFYQTEKKKYDYLTNRMNEIHQGLIKGSYKHTLLTRMRFIYNLKSKLTVSKHLLKNIIPKDEKGLIFTGTIATAKELESKTYHSQTNDNDFNLFMENKIKRLSSVNSLIEGANIPDLDFALIHQIKSKERRLIQTLGRIVRYRPGHRATIYIIVSAGTVDEQWLENAMENIDKSNVKYFNIKLK